MMRQSLADMTKRSASRIQFGVPIRNFPLIQEKLVKARVNSFVAAAMNDFTATLLQQDPNANLAIETSHCKLFGTTRAWDTLYDAFQVAGGSAYLATNPYEKRLRDFRVATVFEGTTEIHSIYPALSGMRNLGNQLRDNQGEHALSPSLLSSLTFSAGPNGPGASGTELSKERRDWPEPMPKRSGDCCPSACLFTGRRAWKTIPPAPNHHPEPLSLFGLLAVLARMAPEEKDGTL